MKSSFPHGKMDILYVTVLDSSSEENVLIWIKQQ